MCFLLLCFRVCVLAVSEKKLLQGYEVKEERANGDRCWFM